MKKWTVSGSVFLLSLWFGFDIQGSVLAGSNNRSQASAFVLPITKRDSLLNGLHLITFEQPGAANVSAHLRINSGALFDLAGKGGLADLTAAMLLRGCGGLSAKNVADTVEGLGLRVSVTTGWDSTDIVIGGPPDTLESIFDLLGKLVISPAFDQKELDALKTARLGALSQEAQEESLAVHRKALEAVFGSHPFGRPVHGTPESVGSISRQDLTYFHNRFYIANNAEVTVTGETTAEQVTRLARSKLGAWKKGEKTPPTFKSIEPQAARRVFILDRGEDQPARAAVAQIGLSRRAEDYFAAVIMTDVLAQQISKITSVHDGTRVETELQARLIAGPLMVTIKAAPGDLAGDLDVLLDTMSGMQISPPNSERVEAAKARLISSMAERLKSSAGAAEVVLDLETYGLGRDYVVNFVDRVNAITPADVQRAAQTYLKPKSVAVVVAGPASRFEALMKKIGVVAVVK